MFERLTRDARETVTRAQHEARQLRHGRIGTEHLLLGLVAGSATPTGQVLAAHGLTRETVVEGITAHVGSDDLDAEALTTLGIDLDAVRERVEAAFGPGALDERSTARSPGRSGHIPFTPQAKKVIELSLREAIALRSSSISDGHIALGLIREGEGLAMRIVRDRGVDAADLRRQITAALGG